MVNNFILQCDICKSIIYVRWQVGFSEEAPISIVCPECYTILKMKLCASQKDVSIKIESDNFQSIKDFNDKNPNRYFAEVSSELLTYKIKKEKDLVLGDTPFLRTIGYLNSFDTIEKLRTAIEIHKKHYSNYKKINNLYLNGKKNYLNKELESILDRDIITEEDTIRGLYEYNIKFYSYFIDLDVFTEENKRINSIMTKLKKKETFKRLISEEEIENYIIKYEAKVFRAIQSLLDDFQYLVPGIILQDLKESKREYVLQNYTITTVDFKTIKETYLEVYENIVDTTSILVALDNINNREDINDFYSCSFSSVKNYNKKAKKKRLDYCYKTNEYFTSLTPRFNNLIRNSIGHDSWEYNVLEHRIYDGKYSIYLIEFIDDCWKALLSSVLIYKIIQDIKIIKEVEKY